MAYIGSFVRITECTVPKEIWDQVWFSLKTWRGFLASVPGFVAMRSSARELDDGDVRLHVATYWKHVQELEEWHDSEYDAAALLQRFELPVRELHSDTFEALD